MTLVPLRLATDGFFTSQSAGENTLNPATLDAIRDSVWTAVLSQYQMLGTAGKALSDSKTAGTEILEQLKADYFKGDTRFIRYRQGTLQIILDKDVTFNPDTGYTITEHQ